jgi:hypothetical protein
MHARTQDAVNSLAKMEADMGDLKALVDMKTLESGGIDRWRVRKDIVDAVQNALSKGSSASGRRLLGVDEKPYVTLLAPLGRGACRVALLRGYALSAHPAACWHEQTASPPTFTS